MIRKLKLKDITVINNFVIGFEIGKWNMDLVKTIKFIFPQKIDLQSVTGVDIVIFRDDDPKRKGVHIFTLEQGGFVISAIYFKLWRNTGSIFDTCNFDDNTINRGVIKIYGSSLST